MSYVIARIACWVCFWGGLDVYRYMAYDDGFVARTLVGIMVAAAAWGAFEIRKPE